MAAPTVCITLIGGPTALIEIDGWRILTDPTFDAPGRHYRFAPFIGSRKLAGPAIAPEDIGPIDAVLLSHDHHDDNLDDAGRALLPGAGAVITTRAGARRLGGNARGLRPWEGTRLGAEGRPAIEITATPCRHGPPGSKPLVGEVTGFALKWEGQEHGVLWITGDTVLYDGVREVADRFAVDIAMVHLGGVRFPISGPLHYTLTAGDAVELCRHVKARTIVPIHYEGWEHFRESHVTAKAAFAAAEDLRNRVMWLEPGVTTAVPG